jgi:hypothetical protein
MFKIDASAATLHLATLERYLATAKVDPRVVHASVCRVMMALSQTAESAVKAMGPLRANSRDEVMKGFKGANPSLTKEDLEEIADNWEKHKDTIKDKNSGK